METRIDLPETPEIVVNKNGKTFTVKSVSALTIFLLQEACSNLNKDRFNDAIEALFGEQANEARELFTFSDIGRIIKEVIRRDLAPLAELSSGTEDGASPMENAS